MNLKSILLGSILVMIVILGSVAFMSSVGSSYGKTISTSSYSDTINKLNQTQNRIENIKNVTSNIKFEGTASLLFYAPYEMMKVGWSSILLIFDQTSLVSSIVSETVKLAADNGFGIPSYVSNSIIYIIIILIIIILIEMFFRWKLES